MKSAKTLLEEEFEEVTLNLNKLKTVWVATVKAKVSRLEGERSFAIVMNAKSFKEATDIDYFITNVESSKVTANWVVTTYSQRNWVEVFYREAKGWLGLREYQVRDKRSLLRHFILVFCAYTFIQGAQVNWGITKTMGEPTFKHFYRSFGSLSYSHVFPLL